MLFLDVLHFIFCTSLAIFCAPLAREIQACKAKENISAKLRQNIGQESLLIAALSTLFKPRVFDLILEQIQSSCMFHLWFMSKHESECELFTAYL